VTRKMEKIQKSKRRMQKRNKILKRD